jgi:competence protein ComEA
MQWRTVWIAIALVILLSPALVVAKVNINTATEVELETLNKIGPALAAAIIEYRTEHGAFTVIEDIMKVAGIKEGIFAIIKDDITVSGDSTPAAVVVSSPDAQEIRSLGTAESRSFAAAERKLQFTVAGGREGPASVHAPIEFQTSVDRRVSAGARYHWSFGDGGEARGRAASHAYLVPGNYVVVFAAEPRDHDETATVARATVAVEVPVLALQILSSSQVVIVNHGKKEVNLGGWSLASGSEHWSFPVDTIILPGAQITLSFTVTAGEVALRYPDGTPYQIEASRSQLAYSPLPAAPSVANAARVPEEPPAKPLSAPSPIELGAPAPGFWQRLWGMFK